MIVSGEQLREGDIVEIQLPIDAQFEIDRDTPMRSWELHISTETPESVVVIYIPDVAFLRLREVLRA